MNTYLKQVFMLVAMLFFVRPSFSIDTKEKQLAAMESILLELEIHYGMITFKKYLFGEDYETLRRYGQDSHNYKKVKCSAYALH